MSILFGIKNLNLGSKTLTDKDFEKTQLVDYGDLDESEKLSLRMGYKMSNWGRKKREKFEELEKDYGVETAYLIVEEYGGVNPGFHKKEFSVE